MFNANKALLERSSQRRSFNAGFTVQYDSMQSDLAKSGIREIRIKCFNRSEYDSSLDSIHESLVNFEIILTILAFILYVARFVAKMRCVQSACLVARAPVGTDQIHKSHSAPVPYPAMHHPEQQYRHCYSEWCMWDNELCMGFVNLIWMVADGCRGTGDRDIMADIVQ